MQKNYYFTQKDIATTWQEQQWPSTLIDLFMYKAFVLIVRDSEGKANMNQMGPQGQLRCF